MRLIICVFGVLLNTFCAAQDLIVMPEGDSLNCKITKVQGDNIYFKFTHKGEARTSMVNRTEARDVRYGFYIASGTQVGTAPAIDTEKKSSRWRLSALAGYGYRIGKIPPGLSPDVNDYLSKLKSGFSWEIGAGYSFSEYLYLDFIYRMFSSSSSHTNLQIADPNGNVYNGAVSDEISISYIGPVMGTRLSPGKKSAWIFDFTLGYTQYKDQATVGSSGFRLEGANLGYGFGIGYEYSLSARVGLGLKINGSFGRLNDFTLYTPSGSAPVRSNEPESLSRLDFMAGLTLK